VRVWSGALRAEPRRPSRDRPDLHRGPKDSLQRRTKLSAFVQLEVPEAAGGVDPGSPQHLVGQHVPQASHDTLVHQHGLQRPATAVQTLLQAPSGQPERVRALLANHLSDAVLVVCQPDAAEFALVPEHKVPAADTDDYPVEAAALRLGRFPDQAAGHAEVEQDRRSVCGCQQPFPAAVWLRELSALKLSYEGLGRPAPNHARIANLDRRDRFPDNVAVQQPTEPLDIGQFRHSPNLPLGAPPGPARNAEDRRSLAEDG
jgi:hypothetical protein